MSKRNLEADLVLLGEFGRAHGLRGEIRLKSHTGDPLAIAGYGPLVAEDGRSFVIASARQAAGDQPDMLVVRIDGVSTREAADALNRIGLHLPRAKLPQPEDEDEFLLADLIGMAAEDEAGSRLGTVLAVPNYGAGELLEIAPSDGAAAILLPFTRASVPVVDVAGRRIVVSLPVETVEPEPEGGSDT